MDVKEYLADIFTFISLMINDAENLFLVLVGYLYVFFEKYLYKFSAHFLIALCVFSVELQEFFIYSG